MKKLKNIKSALWMTVTVIIASSALPLQAAIKENFPTQETINLENRQLLALSWGDIWNKLRRKKGRRGSRSGDEINFCMISPGKLKDTDKEKASLKVWSTQPVFVWKGEIKGIEVRHIRSNKLIWSQSVNPQTQNLIYQGEEPLQPGEAYLWREKLPDNQVPSRVSFRIMKPEERNSISTELNKLESNLKAKGASQEEIILARIEYFAKKQLWSDVFQQVYSVKNPSPKLEQKVKQIESHDFCSYANRTYATGTFSS